MPGFKVPQKEPQVALQPLPSARRVSPARAGDFGELEAEVVGRVGGQIEQLGRTAVAVEEKEELLAAQFKKERDKLLADNALVEFKDNLRKQKQIYFNRRGLDAHGVHNESNDYIENLKKDMKAKMENDEIRALFEARTTTSREVLLNQTMTHEGSEFKKLKDDNINANIDNSILEASNAASEPNSDLVVDSARLDLEFAMDQKVESTGMTGAAAKNFKDEKISTFHLAVLNQKVALDAEGAKEYYDTHKKEIAPDKRESVETLLNKEDVLQFSKEKADEIQITTENPEDWIPTAREEIKDAKKLDATVKRLKTRKAELEQLEVESKIEVNNKITEAIYNAKSREEALGYITNSPDGESMIKNRKTVDYLWKDKKGEPIVSIEQMMTPEYNDLLDNTYINIATNKYKSLGQLRHDTLGSLSKEDQKGVESFWQNGALMGGINMGELRTVYKSFSELNPEENRVAWNASLRYIQRRVSNLPPGKEKIDEIQLNKWMQESVMKSADEGLIFKDKGITFAEAEELGVDIEIEMTTDERDFVISLIEKGNQELIAAGKKPYPITPKTINQGFFNIFGAERIPLPPTPIISPITGGTLAPPTPAAPAPPAPPAEEEVEREAPPVVRAEGRMELSAFTDEKFTEFSEENVDKIAGIIKTKLGVENKELARELLINEIVRTKEEAKPQTDVLEEVKKAQEKTERQLEEAKERTAEEDLEKLEAIGKLQRELSRKIEALSKEK